MQDSHHLLIRKHLFKSLRRIPTHPYQPGRRQGRHQYSQMPVANLLQRHPRRLCQTLRGQVRPRGLQQKQRTIIVYHQLGKTTRRRSIVLPQPTPQARPAHLRSCTCKPGNRSFWMLPRGFPDPPRNSNPVPNHPHLAKRHPGLRHAPGAGIHSHHKYPGMLRPQVQIVRMRLPGIRKRIVHIGNRIGKRQVSRLPGQARG